VLSGRPATGAPPLPAVARSAADGRTVLPPRVTPVRRLVDAPASPPSAARHAPSGGAASTAAPESPATFRSALAHFQALDRAVASSPGGRPPRGGTAGTASSAPGPLAPSPAAVPEVTAMSTPSSSPSALGGPPSVPPTAFSYRRSELTAAREALDPAVLDEIVDRVVERIEERVVDEVERRVHRTTGGVF
jgi:hypothetical protein